MKFLNYNGSDLGKFLAVAYLSLRRAKLCCNPERTWIATPPAEAHDNENAITLAKFSLLILTIFLLSIITSTAYATKIAVSPSHKIHSGNNKYYIDFNPAAKKQSVMKSGQVIWSFSYPILFDDALFISNNGKYVYVVRSKFVQKDNLHKPALLIYSPYGLKAQYSYNKLSIPRDYRDDEVGPIGNFWRVWRKEVKTGKQGYYLLIQTEGKPTKPILMNYGF